MPKRKWIVKDPGKEGGTFGKDTTGRLAVEVALATALGTGAGILTNRSLSKFYRKNPKAKKWMVPVLMATLAPAVVLGKQKQEEEYRRRLARTRKYGK